LTIDELAGQIPFERIAVPEGYDAPLAGAFTSDLLSDVVANAREGDLLITIQAHKNTVAVASLAAIRAIVIASGRPIPDDMIAAARQTQIALYRTSLNQFQASGLVYGALNPLSTAASH
jgi:imidazolonepropionase-like amidohydrolase